MSDTSPTNQRALQYDAPKAPPRQAKPGELLFEFYRERDHSRWLSELRDNSRAGAGWDVMMLENGEPLLSRRCVDERGARFVAASFKKDLLRTGGPRTNGMLLREAVRDTIES
jgi:hypothetical protein